MDSFYHWFLETASRYPNNIALELQRQHRQGSEPQFERYTYAELRERADAIGFALKENTARGSRCAILAANSPRWVAVYLGIMAGGDIAVPLDTAFKADQVRKLLADCTAATLFTDEKHLPIARKATEGMDVQLVLIDGTAEALPDYDLLVGSYQGGFTPVEMTKDDIAAILYTSGTTSDPKGVTLTQGNLLGEADSVFRFITVGPDDAILGVLPLFHALAQMANLLLPLVVGARVVYLESLNTTELMRALRERDCTLFCCVPQFFYLIHQRIVSEFEKRGPTAKAAFRALLGVCRITRKLGINLGKRIFRKAHEALGPRMRYLITGGSRFDPAIATDLRAMGFEILQAYGLTETSGGATCTPPKHNVIGSVGRPLPGQELRIDNPQPGGDGKPAVGEICIRGPIVMKGYWNRSDATTAAIQGGWLHTGDLGYVDSGGNLFITGRKKEIIVLANGKNVYPEEIEDHYQRSPFIKEICVMGLSDPGQPASERLHAVIVPDWDLLRARKIVNAREVIRFDMDTLSAQLPATKRVLSYELWQEELPRTTTRKLKRFEIERMVREKRAAGTEAPETAPTRQFTEEDQQWLTEPEVARALDVVREASKLKKSDLHPKDSLELDLGLDSMERVELLVSLEAALGADVPDSVASEVYTVREMIDAVRAGATGSGSRAFEGWQAILSDTSEAPDVASFFKPHLPSKIFWFVMARMGYLLARDVFHLKVSGMEKLPKQGPYLICPNHQSFMDPPILTGAFPWPVFKQMFSVGTSEIFGNRFTLWIARTLHLYPVDPDANLIPAMKVGAAGLRHGEILLLYPEGERSIDGTPKSFKKGAAILAAHMGVPIYPVAMDGFFEAWPRNKRFIQKFADLKIRVGDPVYPPTDLSEPEKAYDAVIREVRRRVVEMWEQLHTGARPTQPPLQPPHTDVSASVSGNGGPGASRRPEQTLSSKR